MPLWEPGAEPDCSIRHTLSCSCCQAVWDSEDTVVNLYTVFFRGQTEQPRSVLWSLFLPVYSSFQGLILEFSALLIFHKDLQVSNALWGCHNFQVNSMLGRNSFTSLPCTHVVDLTLLALFWHRVWVWSAFICEQDCSKAKQTWWEVHLNLRFFWAEPLLCSTLQFILFYLFIF